MTFEVGQILYLLLNEEMKIIPVRVVEQVVRRRFNEPPDTSYVVQLPNKTRSSANLNDLDATHFTSLDELRNHMIKNAVETIDNMLIRARSTAEGNFTHAIEDVVQQNE